MYNIKKSWWFVQVGDNYMSDKDDGKGIHVPRHRNGTLQDAEIARNVAHFVEMNTGPKAIRETRIQQYFYHDVKLKLRSSKKLAKLVTKLQDEEGYVLLRHITTLAVPMFLGMHIFAHYIFPFAWLVV